MKLYIIYIYIYILNVSGISWDSRSKNQHQLPRCEVTRAKSVPCMWTVCKTSEVNKWSPVASKPGFR